MKSYIPTINISSLLKSEFESKSAINTLKKIEKACVEVGFFQVTGHGISIGAGIYIYLREKAKDQMIVTDTPNR